jgi:hypothetical protein
MIDDQFAQPPFKRRTGWWMVDDCVGMCCQANWGCLDIRLAAELYPNWGFSRKPVLTVHTKPKPENGSIACLCPPVPKQTPSSRIRGFQVRPIAAPSRHRRGLFWPPTIARTRLEAGIGGLAPKLHRRPCPVSGLDGGVVYPKMPTAAG